MKKLGIGFVFGYNSAEAEGSLRSALHIIGNANKEKYDVFLIAVDKNGCWRHQSSLEDLTRGQGANSLKIDTSGHKLGITPGGGRIVDLDAFEQSLPIDVVFPLIPGPAGEDGTVQGMLKLANIPFVGADVLGSAVGMDKDFTKRLCRDAGIPIPRFLTAFNNQEPSFEKVEQTLGLPFFVKPANMGTSIGITKVSRQADYETAVREAFCHDNKLVFEESVEAREIEIAVLGNEDPMVSIPGEVLTEAEWYSYEAKFLSPDGSDLAIPAQLSEKAVSDIQQLAAKVYHTLGCEGMARIDFFVDHDENILLNEINTLPCMSRLSTYPRLWEASGIPTSELIDRLVDLALERFHRDKKLRNWHERWDLTGVVRPR